MTETKEDTTLLGIEGHGGMILEGNNANNNNQQNMRSAVSEELSPLGGLTSSPSQNRNSLEIDMNEDDHDVTTEALKASSILGQSYCANASVVILLFGQVLSFVRAAGGAAQATLRLDCYLSAPALSLAPLYLFLALGIFPLCYLTRKHHRDMVGHKKTDQETLQHEQQQHQPEGMESLPSASAGDVDDDDSSLGSSFEFKAATATPSVPSSSSSSPVVVFSHSLFGLIPLTRPTYVYVLVSLADFYANYFTVWAFKYTTITSVMITDALAIPSAMVLSRLWLGRRYAFLHFAGVAVCMIGIVLNVYDDYQEDHKGTDSELLKKYPRKAVGDLMGILGGLLFGVSNSIAEHLVRDPTITAAHASFEYLSMLGFFATITCLVTIWIYETDRLGQFVFFMGTDKAAQTCSAGKAFGLWMSFSFCSILNYIGTARFLQVSEAVYYNLSLLTSDFWSVGFSVVAEHIKPSIWFYPALVLLIGGNLMYEMTPSPILLQAQEEQHQHEHTAAQHTAATKDDEDTFHQLTVLQEKEETSTVMSRTLVQDPLFSSGAWV